MDGTTVNYTPVSFWRGVASQVQACFQGGDHTFPDFSSPRIAFQWLNQSHNACVNYANRNATKVSMADHHPVSGFRLG